MSYHVKHSWFVPVEGAIDRASDEDLEKWASDPDCMETDLCAKELAKRRTRQKAENAAAAQQGPERQRQLEAHPFDPRTEISADAVHIASRIVKHLWIIFVLLPFVIALLLAIVGVIK
jgi:hypothetical protein